MFVGVELFYWQERPDGITHTLPGPILPASFRRGQGSAIELRAWGLEIAFESKKYFVWILSI